MTYSSLKSQLDPIQLISLDDLHDEVGKLGVTKRDLAFFILTSEPKIPCFLANIWGKDKLMVKLDDAQDISNQILRKDNDGQYNDTPRDSRILVPEDSSSAVNQGTI